MIKELQKSSRPSSTLEDYGPRVQVDIENIKAELKK
jgi:hypothetical protein